MRMRALGVLVPLLVAGTAAAAQDANQPPDFIPERISASFDPAYFTTTYTVNASDPEKQPLTYVWTKKQPVKKCGLFSGKKGTAKWRHPHKSQKDPVVPENLWCEDSQQGGGHKGTVSVVVSDGSWACKLIWPFGSLSSEDVERMGLKAPKQEPCERAASDLSVEVKPKIDFLDVHPHDANRARSIGMTVVVTNSADATEDSDPAARVSVDVGNFIGVHYLHGHGCSNELRSPCTVGALAPGESETFHITLDPDSPGFYNARVRISAEVTCNDRETKCTNNVHPRKGNKAALLTVRVK